MQHKTKMLLVGLLVSVTFLGYFIYTLFDFDGALNVNEATAEQLRVLPGIDAKRAERIVQARQQQGGFKDLAAFDAVAELDEGTQRSLSKYLMLEGPTTLDRVIYKMGPTFVEAKWWWLWAAVLLHMLSFALRAWRWEVLLKPVKHVGFWQSFNPVMIGFTCNTVLPLRVGEVARPALFAAKEGVSFSASFATVVLERVFDLLAVVAVLGITVMLVEEPPAPAPTPKTQVVVAAARPSDVAGQEASPTPLRRLKKYGKVIGPAAFAVIVVFFVVGARPQTAERFLKKCTSFCPHAVQDRLVGFFDKFIVGLQSLENKRDVGWLLFWTALVWLDILAVYYVVALSFSIPLTVIGACLCFVLAAAAVAAPQAPGFIGPFQVAVQFGLSMLQVDATAAASYAIMLWIVSMVPTVIVGLICMSLGGISFGDVTRAGHAADQPTAPEGPESDGDDA